MPILDDDLTLQIYVVLLERLHSVVNGWEIACESSAPAWIKPMVRLRNRASLLKEDLQLLSPEFIPTKPAQMPTFRTEADFLGAMYVMEGSRLGGTVIAKHVEKILSLSSGQGNAYFRGAGAATGSLWIEFLKVLKTQVPDSQADAVIASAQEMFRFFTAAMQSSSSTTN